MTRSPFLGDHEMLVPTQFENVLLYRAPGFNWGCCTEVVVEDALVATNLGVIKGLDAEQQREILLYTTAELRSHIATPRVTSASDRVRVRVAITELQTPNRAVNALTTLLVGPVTTGGASLEFSAEDERTGRRVLAASCFQHGNPIADFASSYSLLGHAKNSIRACIEQVNSVWREKNP
ncbi:TPA: DUF3313 family protein [Pseudomonas aeruginosa]|uniref:DUF3313 family protein n=2 Tax=Pseudomonadota TaxID=1224 RepID=UPI002277918F|nr:MULTISPECIES: DUF3313 family protein [Gammaproteobacteria]MDN4262887.1 DUF3313 family protein [Citrobacter freundii]